MIDRIGSHRLRWLMHMAILPLPYPVTCTYPSSSYGAPILTITSVGHESVACMIPHYFVSQYSLLQNFVSENENEGVLLCGALLKPATSKLVCW